MEQAKVRKTRGPWKQPSEMVEMRLRDGEIYSVPRLVMGHDFAVRNSKDHVIKRRRCTFIKD